MVAFLAQAGVLAVIVLSGPEEWPRNPGPAAFLLIGVGLVGGTNSPQRLEAMHAETRGGSWALVSTSDSNLTLTMFIRSPG